MSVCAVIRTREEAHALSECDHSSDEVESNENAELRIVG